MKLFFKHLARSIVRKPLQPIILVLTMMLAVAVSIFSFSMREGLNEEVARKQAAKYGNAQITVSLSGTSQSRFMFADDAEKLLDGKGDAVGCFELPLLLGEEKKTAFGVATDFYEIGKVFDLTFYQYGNVTHSTLGTAAFLSKEFAENNGLSLGDSFTVTAFGDEKTYTVCGLSENRFIDQYDVMVDITGIVRSLAEDSLMISALGDRFKPCSTIYVKVHEGENVSECIELLREDKAFSDKTVSEVAKAVKRKSNVDSLDSIIDVSVLLSLLLSAAVTFCCFYILASERAEENYAFALSGAKPWRLYFLQYVEIFVYWLIGGGLGVLLSVPLVKMLFSYVGFRYVVPSLSLASILKSTLFLLAAALTTATLFIGTQKLKKKSHGEKRAEKKALLISATAALVLCVFTFIAPMGWRFPLYLVSAVVIFLFNFILAPVLMKWVTSRIDTASDKKFGASYQIKRPAFHYAIKNLHSVKILHNISRLVSILVCIVMTSGLMVASAFGNLAYTEEFFDADYAVLNATERCSEKVAQCETLAGSYKVYMGNMADGGMFSADSLEALSEDLNVKRLPKGNEAVVAWGEAKSRSLRVGDEFTVKLNGQEIELVVCDIAKTGIAFILFDCEHFGIPYNMLMAKGAEGVSSGEVLGEIADKTAMELAAVVSVDTLFEDKLETVDICLNLGLISLLTIIIFAMIGMIDNLYESYRARREEFTLYNLSGMSKKDIRHMKAWEILLTLTFGVLLGGVFFVLSSFVANASFYTFGYSTFYNVLKFFK